jgi:hypothetical protein
MGGGREGGEVVEREREREYDGGRERERERESARQYRLLQRKGPWLFYCRFSTNYPGSEVDVGPAINALLMQKAEAKKAAAPRQLLPRRSWRTTHTVLWDLF